VTIFPERVGFDQSNDWLKQGLGLLHVVASDVYFFLSLKCLNISLRCSLSRATPCSNAAAGSVVLPDEPRSQSRIPALIWRPATVSATSMTASRRTEVVLMAIPSDSKPEPKGLPLFEIALTLVRFDHLASRIVNANHSLM
jgi:hypothetical protein